MKNETKAEKIIRKEIEKYSILKPTSMAKDIMKALTEANLISSNFSVSGSLATLERELKKIEDYFENKTYDGGVTPMDRYKARRREKIQNAIALIKDIEANDH